MFGIPKWNIALIVVVLAAMFGYANYFDTPTPERTVEAFYQSFGAGEYEQAVKYLSINWAYPILFPKYNHTPPADLVKRENSIRSEMAHAFAKSIPPGDTGQIKVSTLPQFTKTGEKTALVVYDYQVSGQQATGKQVALMVRENGKWRLFEISDVSGNDLAFLQQVDMHKMDQRVDAFFKTSE